MRIANELQKLRRLAGLGLLALCTPALAEDIDLFVQPAPPSSTDVPNVLILLDNTANWNQPFTNEIAALVNTVNGLAPDKFRVGLMLFTETGNPNSNVDGGYVRAAVRPFSTDYKTKFMALLNGLDRLEDVSNGGKAGLTMAEAYLYFDGEAPRSGNNKVKTDFTSNVVDTKAPLTAAGVTASNAIYALPGNALPKGPGNKPMSGTPYNSPVLPNSCAPNFIIYISNGPVQDNTSDTKAATTMLLEQAQQEQISNATATIPISPSGSMENVADEWARFMKRSRYDITTYTVDVDPGTTGQSPGWTALLKSMANASSGKYFAVSSGNGGAEIADAVGKIFAEIQAVNSVFASVSLPLSVSTQGTYLNQLYVGVFRPDLDAMPRWNGNLKQYRLAMLNGQLRTVDSAGEDAINAATGFVTDCAVSYWSTADSYWTFRPQGNCPTAGSDVSNSPDGPVAEKGAQAQRLRSTTTRTLKTCTTFNCGCVAGTGTCAALPEFNTTNVTAAMLGVAAASKDSTVGYQRGVDVNDEDLDGNSTTEMRPSAHGDVVHSRPVAINYGTDVAPEIVVFYAGNDGVLRAVNGNRSTAIGTAAAGNELWAFVPFEFHTQVDRLRSNTVPIKYEGSTTAGALPKPYGLDGPLTVYESDDGSQRWLFATARRGGRVVYAFDVSSMDSNPGGTSLRWKIGCSNPSMADTASCTAGFGDLGQTWSAPKVLKVGGFKTGGVPQPLLMMGGGYDTCEDQDPITTACRDSAKGRWVYVLEAATGAKRIQLQTDRPVAGDPFIVTDSETGLAMYAYVVDLGGNVYRIHGINTVDGETVVTPFGNLPPENWYITKIASLGCDSPGGACPSDDELTAGSMNRKFLFSVDVLKKPGSDVYNIMVGSGDREKPLRAFDSALGVQNYFFMIKDRPTDADWLTEEEANCSDEPVICLDSLYAIPVGGDDPVLTEDQLLELAEKKGWYLELTAGEQVVTSAITVFETVTFSTHEPTNPLPGACEADLGTARVYNIDFATANSLNGTNNRYEEVSGGGLPPSPVAGKVILDDGTLVPFIIGADPDSPLQGKQPPETPTANQPKSVTYWFIER